MNSIFCSTKAQCHTQLSSCLQSMTTATTTTDRNDTKTGTQLTYVLQLQLVYVIIRIDVVNLFPRLSFRVEESMASASVTQTEILAKIVNWFRIIAHYLQHSQNSMCCDWFRTNCTLPSTQVLLQSISFNCTLLMLSFMHCTTHSNCVGIITSHIGKLKREFGYPAMLLPSFSSQNISRLYVIGFLNINHTYTRLKTR